MSLQNQNDQARSTAGGATKAATISPLENETSLGSLGKLEQLESLVNSEFQSYSVATPEVSIIIPVYNERDTILTIVERVRRLPVQKQIVIVDDGSSDGTREKLATLQGEPDIDIFLHAENCGKGAALQTGFKVAIGDIVIVQDADLEYNPEDILRVIEPIQQGAAQVVYGSRYLGKIGDKDAWMHRYGNQMLTQFSNLMTGQKLTDMETCYKAIRRELLSDIQIQQRRFGFEPEITGKLARKSIQVMEVPVRYQARSWSEGKKIGVRDLVNALYCIVRYSWFK